MSAALRGSMLTPEVRDVLERSAFVDGVLELPAGQLARPLYVAVNAALEALGGKWNRNASGHVFAADAAAALTELLASGVVPAANPDAFFPTPGDVVDRIIEAARLDAMPPEGCVLEPSAGTGAIALAVRHFAPRVVLHCVELNPKRARTLSDAGLIHVWESDFLTWDDGHDQYERILMNPPFAVEGNATAWIDHVRRALDLLAPDGVLVAVVPNSFEFRSDRKHVAFREYLRDRYDYQQLPPKAFAKSGTNVNCGLLVVDYRGASA